MTSVNIVDELEKYRELVKQKVVDILSDPDIAREFVKTEKEVVKSIVKLAVRATARICLDICENICREVEDVVNCVVPCNAKCVSRNLPYVARELVNVLR